MFISSFKKTILFLLLVVVTSQNYAQLSKTHYIPPLTSAVKGNANPEAQYIYLSTPSESDVSYRVKLLGKSAINDFTGLVSKLNPAKIYIGTGQRQLFIDADETSRVVVDKGYIIEATSPIYVSIRMIAGGGSQAGALVSKGLSALGMEFRVGSFTNQNPTENYLNFVSILATEDNTQVSFSGLPTGLVIKNYSGATPINISLNKGESYTIAVNSATNIVNRDGLIGALVTASKPIVVNCGAANGSFHNGSGRDYGIDQIVGASKIGTDYIFVKGGGHNNWENVLLVAHFDNTQISLNGVATGIVINAGEYHLIEGGSFNSSGNLFVETSEPVFAYQGVGATNSEANQGLFFVPPLSCETRGNLDYIASIENIGDTSYQGGITIVTKKGATVTINHSPIANFQTSGPNNVTGNPTYVTYKVMNLTGDISVQSSDELYCAYFNYNGAATSGSFYSGFPTAPEINFDTAFTSIGICIPNITLEAANRGNFDSIEWYYDDGNGFIPTGIIGASITPSLESPFKSGRYKLVGFMSCSGLSMESVVIPVSICPSDSDNDGIIDNIDIDNDNDGILNCVESFGDELLDLSNHLNGNLSVGNYSFSGKTSTLGNSNSSSIVGNIKGGFISTIPSKLGSQQTRIDYKVTFNKALNIQVSYPTSLPGAAMLKNTASFVLKVPNTKTITLLDPDDQLLVDTNYDAIYESGVTQFSSFEIRFKIKDTSLPIGSGTFRFVGNSVESITYSHINNSETAESQAGFQLLATCIPKDTDLDQVSDAFDYDSDNDGIPDRIEVTGRLNVLSQVDTNQDGLDDLFSMAVLPIDSDNDGVYDFYDLDSDNDGITDLFETGQLGVLSDTDLNGVIDFNPVAMGANGLLDDAENTPDSGVLGYNLWDTDGDGVFNYLDMDSDGDLCNDVLEAGFTDVNNDGLIDGVGIDVNGIVIGSDGYLIPQGNYNIPGLITLVTQPIERGFCVFGEASFTIETKQKVSYQWQVSSDGIVWKDLMEDAVYSDTRKQTLILTRVDSSMDGFLYRVELAMDGNTCGEISDTAKLTVNPLPVVKPVVMLIQCDTDVDGFSSFNLTEVNQKISSNFNNETFQYYETETQALLGDSPIVNPLSYSNSTVNNASVWVRTISKFACFNVSEIQLIVSTTRIAPSFQRSFKVCDDYLDAINDDRDGIATFDFSSVGTEVRGIFPIGQQLTIAYYRNETDALSEQHRILDISKYRNIGYPNTQKIYIRVDSEVNNDCLGLGAHITLTVEKLPKAHPVTIQRQCDDDADGLVAFDTSFIESMVLQNQTGISLTYFDENDMSVLLTNPFVSASQTITIRATNNSINACYDETTLAFIVDTSPVANAVLIPEVCDDESNDGWYDFDTTGIHASILGGQLGMEVSYTAANGDVLSSPLPTPFTTKSQVLTVFVRNSLNGTCVASTPLDFKVNSLPEFTVDSPQILCDTSPGSSIVLEVYSKSDASDVSYIWRNKQQDILGTEETLEVTDAGSYFISLIKKEGSNCELTREIIVRYSSVASISLEAIVVTEDGEANSIFIPVSNSELGSGDYEFSLLDEQGITAYFYQDSPLFEYVKAGIYTLVIRDKYGCGEAQIDISIMGFPKFFTPNNDGYNDTWKVLGVNANFYSKAVIYIFDRYGKLLQKIHPSGNGWDGMVDGIALPSSDYWFTMEFVDLKGNVHIRKGHFSMLRE